ncbi:inositol monophosphatase family protein [Rubellimicrobium sp. CFH 75288]|uniref:inositol monophosphatase family protein n=1 Tax=Rubellimicrobium sp. CFH 75288 TaxID=2697034 RepID=UPI0014132BF5|nr:inositol monophosphatase family protein [Rubellimicrobium sp. CFH 75288]NAZ38331.1 histidinol-phosphatase [Rubellimicrobium sp. CFH 75288]
MRDSLSPETREALVRAAHAAADAARAPTLRHFRQGIGADDKGAAQGRYDPVTEADREAERAMREILARERPGDGILGEEYGPLGGTSGLTWVIDPIDGTRGYLCGTPTWGVLVAVRDRQGPLFGLIDQPYTGERFEGGLGRARLAGPAGEVALRTARGRRLSEARLLTTFPEIGTPAERAAFDRVAERVRLVRYGMDCYAYALLALGQVDLVIEAGLQPYDVAAPIAVVEAAGGLATDWDGGPAHEGGRLLAAADADLHAAALALLQGA